MRRTLLSTLAAGAALVALATAAGAQSLADAKQGGEMVVTYKDDVSTLDPAIGYDWQNWSMIKSLFDGLMDYEPGTTTLVPDLAESYEISGDGTVFTFKLRPGVKFHNGRELVADDVKYSIERVVKPETQSPGAGFFATIAGFDDFQSGAATELAGIKIVDPATIEFTLSQPDATFLHKMALNFAHVVPKEAVDEAGADFGRKPVGTGAYKLAEWTLGQRVVFERNPDYWKAGVPKLDQITFEIGQEPTVALLRLQRGEVDILGDGIPPAQFLQVKQNPGDASIVEGGQLHTGYVTMNVNVPPFDDVKVRQAVNMAINKDRVVQIINNRGVPANQPLPPSMPGYAKDYTGYPHDPEGAKALLAEAGQGAGFETDLFVYNTDPNPRIAQAIQQDLAQVGIKANIQSLAQANVIAAGGEKDGRADDLVGGHGVDRRLPRSVELLRADPRLRRRGAGRLELVVVLQRGDRQARDRGRRDGRSGEGGRARGGVERDLRRHHEGRALGAGLQRAEVHHALAEARRAGRDLRRSGAYPRPLRLRVFDRCAVIAGIRSTAGTSTTAGTTRFPRCGPSRRGRRSASSATTRPTATSGPRAPRRTWRRSTSPR